MNSKLLRITNSREHEDLGRVDRATAQDDLARTFNALDASVLDKLRCHRAISANLNPGDMRLDNNIEIRSMERRRKKRVCRTTTPARTNG